MRLLAILITLISQPFAGITYIDRTETSPRAVHMHIVQVDLIAPGLRFKLSPPSGGREVDPAVHARLSGAGGGAGRHQRALLPAVPFSDRDAWLIGIAASEGRVYSASRRRSSRLRSSATPRP